MNPLRIDTADPPGQCRLNTCDPDVWTRALAAIGMRCRQGPAGQADPAGWIQAAPGGASPTWEPGPAADYRARAAIWSACPATSDIHSTSARAGSAPPSAGSPASPATLSPAASSDLWTGQ